MRESMILLKKYLNFKDYWIIAMFKYINLEIGSSYYDINKEVLIVLCEYLKNKDFKKLNQIWGEKSIQYDILEFCEFAYEYFSKNPNSTKIRFQENLSLKLKKSLIKELLLSFYDELYSQYLIGKKEKIVQDNYSYIGVDFDIHYLKNVDKIEIREIYTNGDIFFYLIVDGVVTYKNKLLVAQDLLISTKKPKELKMDSFISKSSMIMFVIKKQFLNKLNIKFELSEEKLCKVCNMFMFNSILNRKKIDENDSLILLQLILYLLEKMKNNKRGILNMEWIKYKSEIINFVESNCNLDEKDIGEKLLEKLDMSLSKMYKVFKFLFNMTPGKYIEKMKIRKSYKLLIETNKSIEDIAEELGYNFRTFVRKFENINGYSPSKFRKTIRSF